MAATSLQVHPMPQTLLIVEESLRDLKAHWFEYIKTIVQVARLKGDQVDVACHCKAAPEIRHQFNSFPVFRYARYLDNSTQSSIKKMWGDRYYGFMLHSWRCIQALWPLLAKQPRYNQAFVPTVLVHHLLAWWAIMSFHPNRPERLTLFFVTNPGIWNTTLQQGALPSSLNIKLQGWLLRRFKRLVSQNKVRLAVETQGARKEFEALSQLPFVLMAHPVPALPIRTAVNDSVVNNPTVNNPKKTLTFACYGFARYEKGSDIFKSAIETILENHPGFTNQFRIQWLDSFALPHGTQCSPESLQSYPQVDIINHSLSSESYCKQLQSVDCMVLPYRNSSYYARVSRIAIESAYLGIPIIYTCGGWLEDTVSAFGAGIGISDESPDELVNELVQAIEKMAVEYTYYRHQALNNVESAKHYFSADYFYQQIFNEQ